MASIIGLLMRRIENNKAYRLRDEFEMLLLNLASYQRVISAKR